MSHAYQFANICKFALKKGIFLEVIHEGTELPMKNKKGSPVQRASSRHAE
jgi:hypothetical protein